MSAVAFIPGAVRTPGASALGSRDPSRAALLAGAPRPRGPKMAASKIPRAVFTGGNRGGREGPEGGKPPDAAQIRRREQEKEQRRVAAQRVVRSAAGVSRAEALRIGLDQRSTYTVLDFLRSEDILGPATSADAAPVKHQGPSVPLNAGHRIADMPPAFVNEDAWRLFSSPPNGVRL